jgi:tRNA uridine 5-carboxymethylaminomethyl modification enzyme
MTRLRLEAEDEALRLAESTSIRPEVVNGLLETVGSPPIPHAVKLAELAKRQGVELSTLLSLAGAGEHLQPDALVTADLQIKYAGYFVRERAAADRLRRMGAFALNAALPYELMHSISLEARQKLQKQRPLTLAQAASIPGVSPSDLQNLVLEVERLRRVASVEDPTS